jgi:hypothetical protein
MRYELRVDTGDRYNVTTGIHSADLPLIADFLATLDTQDPRAEFTFAAQSGPHFTARYADVTSVRLEIER